jgi:Protein of unknown function (DUF2934)
MTNDKKNGTVPRPLDEEAAKLIEEAAYHNWLDRGRYAQPGNELDDWLEAEKRVRNGAG